MIEHAQSRAENRITESPLTLVMEDRAHQHRSQAVEGVGNLGGEENNPWEV